MNISKVSKVNRVLIVFAFIILSFVISNRHALAQSGNPVISGVSPNPVAAGATLTINGQNLVSVVQFCPASISDCFDSGNGRISVAGTVNGAGTQVTVMAPSSSGSWLVRVRASATSYSQEVPFTVSDLKPGSAPADATPGWKGSLAYNPGRNEWLVVSEGGGIYGRIMDNGGNPVTSSFRINSDTSRTALAPKVAYASDINKYLVVWFTESGNLFGAVTAQFINPDGSFDGANFGMDIGTGFFMSNSVLRYDSVNKKFVFVYIGDSISIVTIYANRTFGTQVRVSGGGGYWRAPSLAVNERNNEYCVAFIWLDNPSVTTAIETRAARVDASTGAVGTETVVNGVGDATHPAIEYNTVENKYFVAWNTNYADGVKGKILNSCNGQDGGPVLPLLPNTGEGSQGGGTLAYNAKSKQYAVIGQDASDAGNTYGIFDSSMRKLAGGVIFTDARNGNFVPSIAANIKDGTFSAISSRDYELTRFIAGIGTGNASTKPQFTSQWTCSNGLSCVSTSTQGLCTPQPYMLMDNNQKTLTFSVPKAGRYKCSITVTANHFDYATTPETNEVTDVYFNSIKIGSTQDKWCPPDSQTPCSDGRPKCGGVCCPSGQSCQSNQCAVPPCSDGRPKCGSVCCPSGQSCQSNQCVTPPQPCSDGRPRCGSICCNSGEQCIGNQCCPSGRICGNVCCHEFEDCVSGTCCPQDKACDGICCPDNQICSSGKCCQWDKVCGGQCCSGNEQCTSEGCCNQQKVCRDDCCTEGEICGVGGCVLIEQ